MLTRLACALALAIPSLAVAGPGRRPAPPAAPAPRPARADDALARVQAFYARVDHATTRFRQEVRNATFGRRDRAGGTLYVSRPGKMRWDYAAKPSRRRGPSVARSFISNGRYLYVVDHDTQQVLAKDLEQDLLPTAVAFLHGKGDLAAEFTPALDTSGTYGAASDVVLALTPRTPSAQYRTLVLVADPGTYQVKESIIVDGAGNTNHLRFERTDLKAPVEERWFEFDPRSLPTYRLIAP